MNFIISDLILLDYSANIPQSSCKLPAESEKLEGPNKWNGKVQEIHVIKICKGEFNNKALSL